MELITQFYQNICDSVIIHYDKIKHNELINKFYLPSAGGSTKKGMQQVLSAISNKIGSENLEVTPS